MVQKRHCKKVLKSNGWKLARHGANHDVYTNGKQSVTLPRHSDINKFTWQGIVKEYHLKE